MTNEEAAKILNTVLSFGRCDCQKEEIEECLKMAIKALEQTRWIPCTERLPKTNDIYLVSMHSYGLPTRAIDGYIQQTEKWEVYGNKVIAWMPLPEAYKAESEKEE